jgi:hypothetical protein
VRLSFFFVLCLVFEPVMFLFVRFVRLSKMAVTV